LAVLMLRSLGATTDHALRKRDALARDEAARAEGARGHAELTALAWGEGGVFPARAQQLRLGGMVQGVLRNNNILMNRFVHSAADLYAGTEVEIAAERQTVAKVMEWGLALLTAAGLAALLGGLLIFLYVRRNVISRVLGLQRCMLDHAEGRPAEIPLGGGDEIADMAATFAFHVDEIRRREEALDAARREADRANEAKSAFLANMSHEIRTPLSAVIGFARLAHMTAQDPRQRDYLGKIQSSSAALLAIINDILDFSKIEAGRIELETIEFSVAEVLDDLSALIGTRAEEKGLEVVFAPSPALPERLTGDPLRLCQVLTNLCANAIKFTDVGEVVVTAEPAPDESGGVTIAFAVRDTGIGLSEEQRSRLFQPFSQADSSTTRRFGGTGLGLSISRRLVEMMGGRIWVDSEEGVGSTFRFTARFGRCPRTAPEGRWADLRGARVLVVDDNATARTILAGMLASLRCRVTEADGGEAALAEVDRAAAAGEEPYRLVLMDWRMPSMDGLEASRRMKQAGHLPTTPVVIMVTAYAREEVLSQPEAQATLDGLLVKPVNPSTLFDTMMSLVAGGPAAPQMVAEVAGLPAATAEVLAGRHVLLTEDNAIIQQVGVEILTWWGISVDVANNGREALLTLEERGPEAF
ncbi:MAG: response regulator, partial [Alphaproteobacteria bacterium]|nr:response regulator [Alphaproteobacteria bacterium]